MALIVFSVSNAWSVPRAWSSVEDEIDELETRIEDKQSEIEKIRGKSEEYRSVIDGKRAEAVTLSNEISLFDNEIARTQLEIERYDVGMELAELEIAKGKKEVEQIETRIVSEQGRISELLRLIHKNDQKSLLEILILHSSFSEFFNRIRQLSDFQRGVRKSLSEVKSMRRNLELNNVHVLAKQNELHELKLLREKEQVSLLADQEAKQALLSQAKNTEDEFQNLMVELRSERRLLNLEILRIEEEIREKIKKKAELGIKFPLNPDKLMWPLVNNGISTYFHDPDYPFKRVVGEHSGLDIRTLIDGTPSNGLAVHSAAAGIVVKIIHDGRLTGNAVFISHGDIMTVYLHLSRIDVEIDEVLDQGQVIGLSGGMPGTYGAGLSSGPHLHFEVRMDGIPVDPCDYLEPACS